MTGSSPRCATGGKLLCWKKLLDIFLHWTQALLNSLALAPSGELVAERAGVLNLSVEGMMLNGARFGFLGAYFSGSLFVAWLTGMLAGALLALLFSFFACTLRSHQVIVALGINLIALGGTSFLRFPFDELSRVPDFEVLCAPDVVEIFRSRDLFRSHSRFSRLSSRAGDSYCRSQRD